MRCFFALLSGLVVIFPTVEASLYSNSSSVVALGISSSVIPTKALLDSSTVALSSSVKYDDGDPSRLKYGGINNFPKKPTSAASTVQPTVTANQDRSQEDVDEEFVVSLAASPKPTGDVVVNSVMSSVVGHVVSFVVAKVKLVVSSSAKESGTSMVVDIVPTISAFPTFSAGNSSNSASPTFSPLSTKVSLASELDPTPTFPTASFGSNLTVAGNSVTAKSAFETEMTATGVVMATSSSLFPSATTGKGSGNGTMVAAPTHEFTRTSASAATSEIASGHGSGLTESNNTTLITLVASPTSGISFRSGPASSRISSEFTSASFSGSNRAATATGLPTNFGKPSFSASSTGMTIIFLSVTGFSTSSGKPSVSANSTRITIIFPSITALNSSGVPTLLPIGTRIISVPANATSRSTYSAITTSVIGTYYTCNDTMRSVTSDFGPQETTVASVILTKTTLAGPVELSITSIPGTTPVPKATVVIPAEVSSSWTHCLDDNVIYWAGDPRFHGYTPVNCTPKTRHTEEPAVSDSTYAPEASATTIGQDPNRTPMPSSAGFVNPAATSQTGVPDAPAIPTSFIWQPVVPQSPLDTPTPAPIPPTETPATSLTGPLTTTSFSNDAGVVVTATISWSYTPAITPTPAIPTSTLKTRPIGSRYTGTPSINSEILSTSSPATKSPFTTYYPSPAPTKGGPRFTIFPPVLPGEPSITAFYLSMDKKNLPAPMQDVITVTTALVYRAGETPRVDDLPERFMSSAAGKVVEMGVIMVIVAVGLWLMLWVL